MGRRYHQSWVQAGTLERRAQALQEADQMADVVKSQGVQECLQQNLPVADLAKMALRYAFPVCDEKGYELLDSRLLAPRRRELEAAMTVAQRAAGNVKKKQKN